MSSASRLISTAPRWNAAAGNSPWGALAWPLFRQMRYPTVRRHVCAPEVPWTFYVSGYDAEENPDIVRNIARSGVEVGSHGYLHEGVDPGDAEPELLERTHKVLTDIRASPHGLAVSVRTQDRAHAEQAARARLRLRFQRQGFRPAVSIAL